jgi:hypothetical protein
VRPQSRSRSRASREPAQEQEARRPSSRRRPRRGGCVSQLLEPVRQHFVVLRLRVRRSDLDRSQARRRAESLLPPQPIAARRRPPVLPVTRDDDPRQQAAANILEDRAHARGVPASLGRYAERSSRRPRRRALLRRCARAPANRARGSAGHHERRVGEGCFCRRSRTASASSYDADAYRPARPESTPGP